MSPAVPLVDPWQLRLERMRRILPLPLLALSTAAALIVRDTIAPPWARVWVGAPATAAAAVLWIVLTARPQLWQGARSRLALFLVHTALAASLVWVSRAYGVFAYVGFLYAYGLGRRTRVAGFVLTALVVSATMSDGYPFTTGQLGTYLFVAVVMVALVMNSASITSRAIVQNQDRGRIIDELAEANRKLEASLAENARLHDELVATARESGIADERRRLAGEIHDTLAQGLAGIVTQLQAAEVQIGGTDDTPGELRRHLRQAGTLARESLTEARRSVRALRPEQLERASLPEALVELVDGWAGTSDIDASCRVEGDPGPAAAEVEDALFRVAQESLTNVGRHADARRVSVTLTRMDEALLLDVVDDGRGFDTSVNGAGFGLPGMRHRLERLGGRLTIESAPGHGTAINATAPLVPLVPLVPQSAAAPPAPHATPGPDGGGGTTRITEEPE